MIVKVCPATLIEPKEFDRNHGLSMMANTNPGSHGKHTYEVRSLTLQAALQEHGIEAVDVLKIDIEGAEADVFESCIQ